MKNYSILAKYYDRFSQNDCDYFGWSQYLCAVAKKHDVKRIVDVACGTGKMTKLLCDNGFEVVGVDASHEMLAEARNKCRATFVCQDMKKLALTKPFDMAVVVNDGVNYLKPQELVGFFANLAANLRDGAPLVFDVSSPYKLKEVLGDNVFFVDDEDATLLWANTLKKQSVTMNITLFEKQGEKYCRMDEEHTQYIHTEQDIESALAAAGFVLVEVTAEYGKKNTEQSLRTTYFATKG